MTDPTFRNIKKLLFQSFKVGVNNPTRNSFVSLSHAVSRNQCQ